MVELHVTKRCEALVAAYMVDDMLHIRYDTFTLVMSQNDAAILRDAMLEAQGLIAK